MKAQETIGMSGALQLDKSKKHSVKAKYQQALWRMKGCNEQNTATLKAKVTGLPWWSSSEDSTLPRPGPMLNSCLGNQVLPAATKSQHSQIQKK